jgi:hypothetical protein
MSDDGFVKVYGSIRKSSVWVEPPAIFKVWMTLLVEADPKGRVFGTVPGLANSAAVSVRMCRKAIERFEAPDPDSRTPDNEGRRLVPIDGGWQLLNYEKYRERRTEKQVADAARQQRQRDRERDERDASRMSHTEDRSQRSDTSSSSSAVAELLAAVPNPAAWQGIIAQAQDGMLGPMYRATATQIEAAALDFIAGNHHQNNPSPTHFRSFIKRAVRGEVEPKSRGGTGQRSADNARRALEELNGTGGQP